jgi:hypothetical protein
MMGESNKFLPTQEWPLQENYKRQLHEYIQRWGERVADGLSALPEDQRTIREPFFQWLVECVPRGDGLTADTIQSLDLQIRYNIGYSYYQDKLEYVSDSHPMLAEGNCRQFEALFRIFQAGQLIEQGEANPSD